MKYPGQELLNGQTRGGEMKRRTGRVVYAFAIIGSFLTLLNVYASHAGKAVAGVSWLAMPDDSKKLFLTGFEHGLITAYVASQKFSREVIVKFVPRSDREQASKVLAEFVAEKTVENMLRDWHKVGEFMTRLYEDPANAHIRFGDMANISIRQLDGANIEHDLTRARQNILKGMKLQ